VISLAATLVACHASFWMSYFSLRVAPTLHWLKGLTQLHLHNTVAGAVGGLILGAIQLLLVRHLSIKPAPWLLVSVLGGALGGLVSSLYSLRMWELPANQNWDWWVPVLVWAVPGGLWAGLAGGTQLLIFRSRLARGSPWGAALLTMIAVGSAVSWGHGIWAVERALRSFEF
jgi:hypothetical protein